MQVQRGANNSENPPLEYHTPAYQSQATAQIRAKERDSLAVDPLEIVVLDGPKKFTYVSTLLSSKEREQVQGVLLKNLDVFTWSHLDMVGIDPILASHKLNIVYVAKPVRQKVRHFHPDRHQIIQTKVDNLLKAGFIREIKYLE